MDIRKVVLSLCTILFFLGMVVNVEAISFVQVGSAVPQTPQSIVSVTYPSAQTAGNLNVVAVGWNDSTATVTSVTDTRGNIYQLAVGPTIRAGVASQSIYYAKNIAGAAAGGNSVTVNFSVAARFPDIRILEYNGLDRVNPVDVVKAATGTNATSNSGAITTTNANNLLFAANLVLTSTRAAGTGFTNRIITSPDGDIAEDRIVSAVGSYSATAPLTSAGAWIMQMVAFKAASSSPDLTIAKTHTGNFTQGQTGATYSLSVTNVGAASTSGAVTVTDTLPTGLTATAFAGAGWTCTLAPLRCTRSDALAASAGYPAITLTVNVAANAPASVTNTATVSGGGETNTANNTAGNPTTIVPAGTPDLTIAKTHTGNFTQGQTGATYSLSVTNVGAASTTGTVTVTDTLPTGLTATAFAGAGWTCTLAPLRCTRSDALAASAGYTAITLTVNVASNAPASVTNTATVSGGGETNTANNTASNLTTIVPAGTPDLTLTKTHTGNFTQGQTGATYTLTVSNVGGASTSGTVTVTDSLPAGLTSTALSGTGWACTLGTLTCTRSDALAASGSYPAINLTVNVASNAPASVTNTAIVSGGGDTNTANNTANDVTTVGTTAPSVTINQASGQVDPTNASPINFTVIFSKPVTGFSSADVTIGGTAGGTKSVVVTGTGTTYNVAISGMTTGTIIATVAANAAQDAAGNGNTASTSTDNSVTYTQSDTQPPTAPGNLTATAASASQVNLSWGASTDNVAVTGYQIERCQGVGCTNFAQIGSSSTGLSGPLTVPPTNPRYFVDATGRPLILTGSHTWNNLQDWGSNGTPQALDFTAYVNFLVSHGHNFTLLWRTELTKFCGLPTTASSPPDFTVTQHPWQRNGPGTASDGGLKFDLTKFDQSFFDRLRSRVQQLNASGIYAGVYLFTGEWLNVYRCFGDGHPLTGANNINGIDDGGGIGSMIMTAPNAITDIQDAFVDKLIDTLNDLPNVLWIVSEEAPASSTWWNNHLISHVRAYESLKPLKHPIGYAILAGAVDSTVYNSDADWVAPSSRISPTSTCGTGSPNCKVNINDSDHSYFGMWNDTAQQNRNYAWQNFATGNQVIFMDPYVVSYTRENRNLCGIPANGICQTVDTRWNNFRDNLGYILTYSRKLNLANVSPQANLSSTGYCLAQTPATGAEYLVYAPSGGSFTVNLSATTRPLNIEWFSPSTGSISSGGTVTGGSVSQSFTPPFSGDAVLYMVDVAGHAGSAGSATPTTYSDTALTANTSYSYRVRAVDVAGNPGPYSNVASATTLATIPGLVGAYSFDAGAGTTVADTSGSGNTGTIQGATWTTSGKYGNALSFNGASSYVDFGNPASLQIRGSVTLSAWVLATANPPDDGQIVSKSDNSAGWQLKTSPDTGPHTFGIAISPTSTGHVQRYSNTVRSLNTWYHVAGVYNAAAQTLDIYVNGVLDNGVLSGTVPTSQFDAAQNVAVGRRSGGFYFNGTIDEVHIYNVALTPTQIQADMNTPIVPDTQPPTVPGSLVATAISGAEIDLSWTASTDNVGVTGYLVERCQGAGCTNFAQIGTTAGTIYPDLGLAGNTTYTYRVRATDAAGNLSLYSNSASSTTSAPDSQPPTAPSNLVATAVSGTQINLTWTAATDNVGVTGYRVDRCQGVGCEIDPANFVKFAYPTTPSYNDTGLTPNTSYSYLVKATDAAQNLGPYSNVATAVTLATNPNLVAAYSFDEGAGTTVSDISGNGNIGTVANTTWATSGKYGRALAFNGTNARVTINDSASLRLTTAMTLEAWVNPSTVSSAWRDVIYKGNDNYFLEGTSSQGGVPAGGGTFAEVYGPTPLAVNTWSHLAVTYDGATLRLYVNGVQVSSRAQTGNIQTSANPLQIGGDSIFGQYFAGMIDEVRIYNIALTPAQIQTDMNTSIGNPIPDTQPPTAPSNLAATAVSGTQINLNWTASTDNIGVAAYLVERCQGVGCTNFAQIGTAAVAAYSDGSLAGNSTYLYRVRATDLAGNVSLYSNTAQATTGFSVTPRVVALTFTRTQQFTASGGGVTWSVDGLVGGSASSGTITAAGLYTPPTSVGTHTVTASTGSQSANATVFITNYPGTFTRQNDNSRTGQNLNETVLTPANVNSLQFGKLFSYPTDGKAYASPLYVANLNIPGKGFHNVVYVATEHDSVYAFDADGLSSTPLWQVSFINPAAGVTTIPANDTGECCDIAPEIGITGTPVIDQASNTLYVVAKTKEVSGGNTDYVQRLHALDITTGAEKFGGPVVLQATVPGTGTGSQGGQLSFLPLRENQRPALLLSNGVIYIGFSSHGDNQPYHGWILGYNATTLQRVLAFCVTANGEGAGVWMSGGGLAADSAGNFYFVTGDGTFDANTGGSSYGDSFVKMSPSGTVADYFTPHVQSILNAGNIDLGAGGLLLLPDQPGAHPHMLLSAGKDGTIYLIDRDNMGHYNPNNDDQIVQSLVNIFPFGTPEPGNYSSPVYFNGNVYFSPVNDSAQVFHLSNGLLSTAPTSRSSEIYQYPGGTLAISANGSTNAILWAVQRFGVDPFGGGTVAPGVLIAYDPSNLAFEYYTSNQAGTRDVMDFAAKFNVPLVANGKVFVAGENQLTVYGLLP